MRLGTYHAVFLVLIVLSHQQSTKYVMGGNTDVDELDAKFINQRQLKNGLLQPKMKIRDFDTPMVGEGGGAGVFHRALLSSAPSESPSSVPTSSSSKKNGKGKGKGKESEVPSSVPTIPSMEPSLPSSSPSPSAAPSVSSKKKKPKMPKMPKKPKKGKGKGKESEVPSSMPSPQQEDSSMAPSSMPIQSTDSTAPSDTPSASPSDSPSRSPSNAPSPVPSLAPSASPSASRSVEPSVGPSESSTPSSMPSLVPSQSLMPSVSEAPSSTGWCRRLGNFDDSHLWAHIDDPTLRNASAAFASATDLDEVAPCGLKESMYFMQKVSILDCYSPESRVSPDQVKDFHEQYDPWIVPNIDNVVTTGNGNSNNMTATLVAKNPGLWTIDDFLSPDEVDRFVQLMVRNGNDKGMFGPCADPRKVSLTSQPSENKRCFMIGEENMCEGPYQVSTCQHDVEPADGAFIKMIRERAEAVVSVRTDKVSVMNMNTTSKSTTSSSRLQADKFMRTAVALGSTPPQLLHEDKLDVVSFLIYLTDGGAKTMFPGPNVALHPKRGMAAMWLNVDTDGYELQNAFHGVQAHPPGAAPRMIARVSFPRAMNTWTKKETTETLRQQQGKVEESR